MATSARERDAEAAPTVIKKYANRRLYHTGTSTYVTLEDLAGMVQGGEDFLVYDAKSGEDITRSVLTQIIFEQENKAGGQNLLPVAFLRQLIRFYGDSMRALVPSFLEYSMDNLVRDQGNLREKMGPNFAQGFGSASFQHAVEEQVRANVAFFSEAMRMFTPFGRGAEGGAQPEPPVAAPQAPAAGGDDLDALKRQMADMQARLEEIAKR
jgi:polyhydroxyalkanoate synthesis repressor PhaR